MAQQDSKLPAGVPTADQEALQAPYIDPIQLAAYGPTFGLKAMLGSLAMQLLNNQLGVSPQVNRLGSMPTPGPAALKAAGGLFSDLESNMFGKIVNHVADFGFDMPDAIEIAKTDDPEFAAMGGARGWEPQIVDNYQRIIRGSGPLPYAGADIGRPLGLSALLADMRQQYNQFMNPTKGNENTSSK